MSVSFFLTGNSISSGIKQKKNRVTETAALMNVGKIPVCSANIKSRQDRGASRKEYQIAGPHWPMCSLFLNTVHICSIPRRAKRQKADRVQNPVSSIRVSFSSSMLMNSISTGTISTHFLIFMLSWNPKILTKCKLPVIGGDTACPPEPPLRFSIVLYYLFWNYRLQGCHSGGGAEALRAVAPKSVEKNIVRISTKPIFTLTKQF